MRHMPTITELMTAFPAHVDESTSLAEAANHMSEHHCHHLPVMKDHDVVGLLSRADLELARSPGHSMSDISELTAGDMCRRDVASVDLHTRLDVVLDQMHSSGEEAVLVYKRERLAGIFTLQDAAEGFSHWLKKTYLPDDDPSIA
jgi:predicted transcriptional regulator